MFLLLNAAPAKLYLGRNVPAPCSRSAPRRWAASHARDSPDRFSKHIYPVKKVSASSVFLGRDCPAYLMQWSCLRPVGRVPMDLGAAARFRLPCFMY